MAWRQESFDRFQKTMGRMLAVSRVMILADACDALDPANMRPKDIT